MGSCSNCQTSSNNNDTLERTMEIYKSGPLQFIDDENQIQNNSQIKKTPINLGENFRIYLQEIYSEQEKKEIIQQPNILQILHLLFLLKYGMDQKYITKIVHDYICTKVISKLLKAENIFENLEYPQYIEKLKYIFTDKFLKSYDILQVSQLENCKVNNIDDLNQINSKDQQKLIEFSIKLIVIIILDGLNSQQKQTAIEKIRSKTLESCSIIVNLSEDIEKLEENLKKIYK